MIARMRLRAAIVRYRIRTSNYAPRHILYGFTHPGAVIRAELARNSTPRTSGTRK